MSEYEDNESEGYLFEPVFTEEEITEIEEAENESSAVSQSRAYNTNWCTCNMCSVMPDDKQSICCNENDEILKKKNNNLQCIRVHEAFERTILNQEALNVLRYMLSLYEKDVVKLNNLRSISNKSWRYLAYRQFWSWINSWKKLGRNVRFPIPACVVQAIRETWPEDDNNYVGYMDVGDNLVPG
jgi:hypothetical protein